MKEATIRSIIENAAQKEGLDSCFVQQLIDLFKGKGIDLNSDGQAYKQAVSETCKLQATMKASEYRTLEAKKQLDVTLNEIAHNWEEVVNQIHRLQDLLFHHDQRRLAEKHFQGVCWPSQVVH